MTEISKHELLGKRGLKNRRIIFAVLGFVLVASCLFFYSSRRAQRLGFWAHQWRDRGAVVFLGDSIIEGWPDLSGAFPGHKIANRALGGDRSYEVLRRLQSDVLPLNPSGLVLLIGTNDLNEGADPETVLKNIKLIITAVRNKCPTVRVVLCTLTPRASVPGRFPDQILKFNAALKKSFGTETDIVVFDTWSLFANESGQPRPDEFPDLLHPSVSAYQKWASALTPVLNPLMAGQLIATNR